MAGTTPTLALSMIVRDAALSLPACLESVRGIVDEIVVADTGSADDTIEVGLGFGAHVIPIAWTDDFAEARNRALGAVKSDWVLVLDADEQLDSAAGQHIPLLLTDTSVSAYQVTIRNYVLSLEDRIWDRAAKPNDSHLPAASTYPAYVEHENVRLFRRDPEIYFVGRVHESVGPRVLESGRKLGRAPFSIHHFGLVADAETRARKNHFYRRLGQQKVREMPKNAQAHLELGLVELDNFRLPTAPPLRSGLVLPGTHVGQTAEMARGPEVPGRSGAPGSHHFVGIRNAGRCLLQPQGVRAGLRMLRPRDAA